MVTECLAGVYIGDVHFDGWHLYARDGVAQRNRCVGVCARIYNDARTASGAGLMYPVHQRTLMIGLVTVGGKTQFRG